MVGSGWYQSKLRRMRRDATKVMAVCSSADGSRHEACRHVHPHDRPTAKPMKNRTIGSSALNVRTTASRTCPQRSGTASGEQGQRRTRQRTAHDSDGVCVLRLLPRLHKWPLRLRAPASPWACASSTNSNPSSTYAAARTTDPLHCWRAGDRHCPKTKQTAKRPADRRPSHRSLLRDCRLSV
jgi:hypothetical protein